MCIFQLALIFWGTCANAFVPHREPQTVNFVSERGVSGTSGRSALKMQRIGAQSDAPRKLAMLLFASGSVASSRKAPQTDTHSGLVALASALSPLPLRVLRAPQMVGVENEQEEEEETDYAALEEMSNRKNQDKLVDPMTTSLGIEEELEPYPGPGIPELSVLKDYRAVFCHFARFAEGQMPAEALESAYYAWLQTEPLPGNVSLCMTTQLLGAQSFDDFWEYGDVLTDDDIARMDAEEEAAAAEAEASGAAIPTDDLKMETMPLQLIQGHMTIARAPSWSTARDWVATNPVGLVDGYETVTSSPTLHQWLVSTDSALCVKPMGESQQPYVVHCVDKHGQTELRASTRERHLDWLCSSGRVQYGGPLLSPDDVPNVETAEGEGLVGVGRRVGTLLIVSGDSLDEVTEWAASDPYAIAGLFSAVNVAPLAQYNVDHPLASMREELLPEEE